jgi:hypothetical protein
MSPLVIIIILVLLFGGVGLGGRYGGWGGPAYGSYLGTGGIGLGTILVILLVILLLTGRL